MRRTELIFAFIFTFIIAGILVVQLFTQGPRQETTFDGPTHMQTIAQFTHGLRDGDFPVRWGDGFARYGMPIPLVSQQVTAYLGGGINLIVNDVQLSYRFVFFIGAWLSAFLMYYFLRFHAKIYPALCGTFLFNFAPYRIINIYIRGALPEFFASVCVLIALIGLHEAMTQTDRKQIRGHAYWIIGLAGIVLTHPFVLVIASPLLVGYGVYLMLPLDRNTRLQMCMHLSIGAGIAGLLSAYYVIPLLREIHYFNYARAETHYVAHQFLSLKSYFREQWEFFGSDVATRGNILQSGAIEGYLLIVGIGLSTWTYLTSRRLTLLHVSTCIAVLYAISTLPMTDSIYMHTFLGNIQHPWRMLSGLIISVPIVATMLVQKLTQRLQFVALICMILVVAWLRFPQLYVKNSISIDEKSYYVTHENTHGLIMNTVWMGDAREYPYQAHKGNIIEGKGSVLKRHEMNAQREYSVDAKTPIRMVDYTFYFPGWHVYVDDVEVPIQFQDPSYRGILTYDVPAGLHEIDVVFENTRFRTLGNLLSCFGLLSFIMYFMFLPKILKMK